MTPQPRRSPRGTYTTNIMNKQTTEALAAELRQIHNEGMKRCQLSGLNETETAMVALLDVAKHVQGLMDKAVAQAERDRPASMVATMAGMQRKLAARENEIRKLRDELYDRRAAADDSAQLRAQVARQQQAQVDSITAQRDDLVARVSQLQEERDSLEGERDYLKGRVRSLVEALNEWNNKTEWVQKTANARELGHHRADVIRGRMESLQRSRDELSARLADEQRQSIGFHPWDGVCAESLKRHLKPFADNPLTQVRMSAVDAHFVFELAIKALDRPGELAETVGQLRRYAAQVQSTAERLTQLASKN